MRTTFAVSLACAAALGASAAPSITITIGVPQQVDDVNSFLVTTTVRNTGTETLKLLNDPRGVLSNAATKTFDIANESGSPEFNGMLVKYSPDYVIKNNDPTDFTVLEPGQSREITHNLAGISSYDIFQYVDGSGNLATIKATTEPVTFGVGGNLVSAEVLHKRQPRIVRRQNSPQFVSCSDSQKDTILDAVKGAEDYAQQAADYLEQVNSGTDRYTTWFGEYDQGRVSKVASHFKAITGKATQSTYDCSPSECGNASTFAYVYPNQPGKVYLCGAFWNAPVTGTDSKAGTIVHEQTHFDEYGGTGDHAYGQRGCQELAQKDPNTAVMNADSHEYFAENNPFRS
ncbi:Deuterolysin M35 metalloprotease [Ceratobasidium theobromae]|uniref:Deuterolysin M35 metalloprotease n=1 Tax=Ceratobasidium theobromae TaxID=1582974 RepID=A0A5N5Q8E9_9AGAM|nr:Deuterolysin M35 metalloprotease [Ceratobasidium theobromae]